MYLKTHLQVSMRSQDMYMEMKTDKNDNDKIYSNKVRLR